MSNAVAKVSFLQGQAWAKAPDGTLRALTVGSTLNDDEVLVTAQGARVELDVGNGEPLGVNGGMEVGMSRDFLADTATESDEALLSDASVQEALTVLEQGGDLLEELEETAAGNTGGGGSEGHDFVQLTRVIESTNPQAFDYSSASASDRAPIEDDADYINRAPLVTDQIIASNEDEPVTGQIIADDIEDDVMTFSIATPPANGVLALDPLTGQFTFTPNANYNGTDGFVVTVTDSRGNSTNTSITLNIAPVNDAPTTNDINLTTDEDVPVNGQVVAQDIENDTLSYVVSGQPANGTVVLDPATGTFVYAPNANYNGGDSFVVTVSDGNGGATTSLVTIGINPVNDAPVSNDQNLVTDEDTPINGQVVASDVDGDSLGYSVSGQPANGTVSLNPVTGGFVYTPNANYNGSDTFVVTISDGKGGTTTSNINIGINPVNDAPVSSDQNLITPEDVALTGQVVATDIEGDTLAYAVSGQPANGSVSLNPATGGFVYTPNANYNGSDSFVVTISDGNGGTTTSRINIGVTPVNDAPVTSNVNLTTPEDTPISSQISASDVDGDSVTFIVTGSPANGSVSLNPATGTFTYSPNANYNGNDSFTVTISDGNGGTTTSLVSIGVTPVNDGPAAGNLNLTTDEDVPVNGAISANDPDGDTLSYTVSGNPANGTVVLNPATGTFIYTPSAGYGGSDSFVVSVSDGKGGVATSTVTIGVNSLNDDPVTSDLNLTTAEDTAVNGAISATDPESDPLSYSVTGNPANGTVVLNPSTGTFVYTPNANYNGNDSFVVTISDGKGGSTTSNVAIIVTPENDAPVVSNQNLTTDENVAIPGTVGGSDPDGDTISYSLLSAPNNGVLTLNIVTGNFTYTPNSGYVGSDSFSVTLSDGKGGTTNSLITIVVKDVNAAPVANDDTATVIEGNSVAIAVRGNDTDPESDSLSVSSITQGANGSVVIDAVTGNPIYTPNSGFTGTDSFTYTVNDGQGNSDTATVTVTVNPANQPSVINPESVTVDEDFFILSNVLSNDSDTDDVLRVASYEVNGNTYLAGTNAVIAGVGDITIFSTGDYRFTPEPNYHGPVPVITYTTNTGSSSTLTITVRPVNDAPTAVDDGFTTDEDTAVSIPIASLLGNDSDIDGDTVQFDSPGSAVGGTVALVGSNVVFTPNLNFNGAASFTYTISDGKGKFDTATVTVTVNPVNDPGVMAPEVINLPEDNFVLGNVLSNDSDVDDTLRIASYEVNGNTYLAGTNAIIAGVGDITIFSTGDYRFTPEPNYNGPVPVITYTTNTGSSSTLTITVDPANDRPDAVDDSFTTTRGTAIDIPVADLLLNDTDIDLDSLSVNLVSGAVNGTVSISGGLVTFTPNPGFTGTASFTYRVTDGSLTDTATVTINVTPPAAVAPVTNDVTATGAEDTLITVNLAGSDTDGTVVGYVINSLPANGVLYSDLAMTTVVNIGDLVAGPVYFKPDANWNGSTDFGYAARDNDGLTDATQAQASITVTAEPDAAVVGSGAGTVQEDTPAQSTAAGILSITDPDAGEEGFEVQSNTAGTYGSFSITSDGDWTYSIDNSKANVQQLKEGETKTEMFAVKSIDGTTSSVVITVTGTNDGPTAVADTGTTLRNTTLTFTPAELLGNDTDPDGDTLTIDSVQGAVNGNVSLVAGNVVFVPTTGYSGPASFTYTITDGKGGSSTASVDITVVKPNTAPVANDEAAAPTGSGNVGLVSEYFGYQEPANGANLTSIGQVYSFIDGRTPDATFVAKTFDYSAATFTNGLGTGTNLQTFLGSDAASLSADPATTTDAIIRMRGFVELDAGTYNFKVLGDDGYQIRVDGVVVAERNINQSATTTTHNQFSVSAGGLHSIEIIYWDQAGSAKLKLELSDDAGTTYDILSSVPNYQVSTFSAVEDTPLSLSVTSLLGNDTDADGDTLTIQSVQGAVNGTVSLVAGSVIFTPAANYSGPASFTYTISDGKDGTDTATVNLSVAPVNDAPVAVGDTMVVAPDRVTAIPLATLLANDTDIDRDTLTIVSVQGAVNGSVAISGNNLLFTPAANFEGAASFTYTVRDPAGATSTATANVTVGSATTPSMVVSKALVVNAHGTGGTSVKFPIITKLVDTDGSESLTIKVSNVPSGLSFNAGTNLGGGVWQFSAADLPNLSLNLPGSYTTNATHLTVQVTATEINGGATASVSNVVTLKAAYTTVDITTTESGSYTGSSANEYIQGGNGNNTINASNGSNIVYGGAGDDNLSAGAGSDLLFGGSDNDIITSGSGADRISGGSGNDTFKGGDAGENFVDVFVWSLGDQGVAGSPAVDTIQDFATAVAGSSTAGGDVLDLRDLLQGESVGASNGAGNLANYLHFEVTGGDTIIHISHAGGFSADSHTIGAGYTGSAETQKIVLSGVDLQSLYSGATTDQQIITQLLNNNKLITD